MVMPDLNALRTLSEASPPDDWESSDLMWGYSGHGERGDVDFVDGVDESNMDDVHEHGVAVGLWLAAKKIREVLG